MCKVKCDTVREGLEPRQRVCRIKTVGGKVEEVTVSLRQVDGDILRAAEVARSGNDVLIELPREAASGTWRIWVADSLVL